MTKARFIQPLLMLFCCILAMACLAGCGGSSTSADSSETDSSSSSLDSSYLDDEEDFSSSFSSVSSPSSGYGTIDPYWRSSVAGGYRTFDVDEVTDWQVPTPEIEDLVNRIEAEYGLGLEFIETQEDEGGWRYIFQDADAQDDRYGGNSLSIKVMPATGMYAAMGLYCVDADDAVGVSEMIAEVFGYDTYPIEEVEEIFNDPDAEEGSGLTYEGGPVYEWTYAKDAGGNSLEKGLSYIAFAFA